MVIKHSPPKEIQALDNGFEKMVSDLDNDIEENCYKHKMVEKGHFIGNDPIIMKYVDSIKANEEHSKGVAQPSSSEENAE